MSLKRIIALLMIFSFVLLVVGCHKEEPKEDLSNVPTAISLKVKTAKVQINSSVKVTYTITPATAQDDNVKISLNNSLATYAKEGNRNVIITAGSETGSVKVTIETSNGIKATKTIKIQLEEVQSYPDLCGYNIKLAQAEHALGEYDVKLTMATYEKYGYYGAADKEYKSQAWDEIEENYNCSLTVDAYPSDAPWGPARWAYILEQAQNDSPEYDLYVVPDSVITSFVAGNAIVDVTDWYAAYGNNLMNDMAISAYTYKQRLYSINDGELNVYNVLCYNVGLLEKIQKIDQSIEEPAQMYLDNNWNYDTFKTYCLKVQTALNSLDGEEQYYCLSGYGSYYWIGLVNAGGIKILDTTQLKVNILGETESKAAKVLQDIYAAEAMDPSFQVDQNVGTWNNGKALFNTGDYWFINATNRWSKTLWGSEENTKYGYVPFPGNPDNDPNQTFLGSTAGACIVVAAGREWAYSGFGEDCTTENIYRAYMDYLNTARKYYKSSEDYNYEDNLRSAATSRFATEASVKAYLRVMLGNKQEDGSYVGGIEEWGFYDPYVTNINSITPSVGTTGFAGGINDYIRGKQSQWVDAVGAYEATINQSIVDKYG